VPNIQDGGQEPEVVITTQVSVTTTSFQIQNRPLRKAIYIRPKSLVSNLGTNYPNWVMGHPDLDTGVLL